MKISDDSQTGEGSFVFRDSTGQITYMTTEKELAEVYAYMTKQVATMNTSEAKEATKALFAEEKPLDKSWWHYILVRKELAGGAAMAQACHAAAYSANQLDKQTIPEHTRMCVLAASKEQMAAIAEQLLTRSDEIGATLNIFKECEGELSGVITSIGFLTSDKEKVRTLLAELKPWRK